MTLTELTPYVALGASVLAIAALGLIMVLSAKLSRLQKAQKVILGSKGEVDIVRHVGSVEEKLTNLRVMVEDLAVAGKDYEVRIDNCVSHVGAVRFDAFRDLGGRQSTSVALLSAADHGIVITSAVSREFARIYVKLIRDGQPDVPLAPEEIEAVELARSRGNAPFTVRPRKEREREEEPPTDTFDPLDGQPGSSAAERALERENRRRKRQGLPPLDEVPPLPSTLGWPKFETAADPDGDDDVSESEPVSAQRDEP